MEQYTEGSDNVVTVVNEAASTSTTGDSSDEGIDTTGSLSTVIDKDWAEGIVGDATSRAHEPQDMVSVRYRLDDEFASVDLSVTFAGNGATDDKIMLSFELSGAYGRAIHIANHQFAVKDED